jgi:hypothetical protein
MDCRKSRRRAFAAHIEQLEDRRVMSADPLTNLVGGIEHHDFNEAPAAAEEAPPLDQHLLSTPDFWISSEDASPLDGYFDQIEQTLIQAHQQTGWFNVQSNYGFTGRGQTVAVIDSGVAYDHFALGGGLGANYRVVGGWDFSEENDANPYDDGTKGGHGSHVAGIIGSDSSTHSGVAPGVDLVALRVFNDAGAGYFSWVENALKWVLQNRNSFENPITAINLSLGVSSWNAASVPAWANLEDEFAQLEAAGIFIAVSAGNSYSTYKAPGLSYPAASQYVVPVMSTDDGGALSYFSQRLSRAIAAPGRNITSTVPDYKGNNNGVADDYATMSGTSMAAPYVAGASVLVREAMQFVGMTNITQDMIYDHMMATADMVFDTVSNMSFKRLNLQAAIDSLMPADDYGSTQATAHNLGALSSSTTINGMIGKLNDQDYFSFTAAASGQATFTATTLLENMAPSWQVFSASGQSLGTASGEEIAFDVVAGQRYAVRLSSTGGLGHYVIEASAAAAASIVDWGAVSYTPVDDVAVAGEQWYRVQATSAGYLTVLAQFDQAAGAVDAAIFNANMQQVAASAGADGQARVDVQAAAGAEFFVRLSGANNDVDLKLVNLVNENGGVVTAAGTAGDDTFAYTAGASHTLSINGVAYSFAAGAATQFNIDGGAGVDTIVLTGSSAAETAALRSTSASLTGSDYAVDAVGFENVTAYGGGGADIAFIYDSAGDDVYRAYADRVIMTGDGYSNEAQDFSKTYAFSSTGVDRVYLYDTEGDDVFSTSHRHAVMSGSGYYNYTRGFEFAYGYASGGFDVAYHRDSPGDDVYTARQDRSIMSGDGFYNFAQGFDRTIARGSTGNDVSYLYDSAGDDVLRSRANVAIMSGEGYYNYVRDFDSIYAYASTGTDKAYMYDSAGDDVYRAWANRGVMSGAGFYAYAQGFDNLYAFSTGGNDAAYLYDSAGDDLYRAWSNFAVMSGANYYNRVTAFAQVYAYSSAGNDAALLYDSAGDDFYRVWSNRVVMSGVGYYNCAQGFASTTARTSTGNDQAIIYDSIYDDQLVLRATMASIRSGSYYHQLRGFDSLEARGSGGVNSVDVQSVDYLYSLIGDWVKTVRPV